MSCLTKVSSLPGRPGLKPALLKDAIALMKSYGAVEFSTNRDNVTYEGQVGMYILTRLPLGKRGHLKPLAGHLALVVCVGSGPHRIRRHMAISVD
jgi:hypothetical protein